MTVISDSNLKFMIKNGGCLTDRNGNFATALSNVQPASVDLTLSHSFRIFNNHSVPFIDLTQKDRTDPTELVESDEFLLHPGEFALASTEEIITLPPYLVAQVNGKSSLGRLGLIVHATAGFIDPGFSGSITLELSNLLRVPIKLKAGMRVAQVCFMQLDHSAQNPYGSKSLKSHYQGQIETTSSRYEG